MGEETWPPWYRTVRIFLLHIAPMQPVSTHLEKSWDLQIDHRNQFCEIRLLLIYKVQLQQHRECSARKRKRP